MFTSSPPPFSIARTNASTTSSTNTKSRVWRTVTEDRRRVRRRAACRRRSTRRPLHRADPGAVRTRSRAQGGVLEAVHLPVVVEVVADGLLRDAVGRFRSLRVPFADGDVLGETVDRAAGAREHDLARARGDRALEDVQRAEDVHLGVERGTSDRDADVGLRGEMKDHLRFAVSDEIGDRGRAEIEPMERESPGAMGPASARFAASRSRGRRPRRRRTPRRPADRRAWSR